MAQRILLKTTIPTTDDDWHVGRFALLAEHLRSDGHAVTARDREPDEAGDDRDLAAAARGEYDQLWLFAVDTGDALTERDADNIAAFRARGGGVFLTRDHQDLGSSLARLGPLGATHNFQTVNPESDVARHCCDDLDTPDITWPNYHSGANGDVQTIAIVEPLHPVLRAADGAPIARLPAHPHEGSVAVPDALAGQARVIARGRSAISGAEFNLAVALEQPEQGRAIADSSFHHIADYNWDPRRGCPSFVTEAPGDAVLREPGALDGVRRYVSNLARWLGGG